MKLRSLFIFDWPFLMPFFFLKVHSGTDIQFSDLLKFFSTESIFLNSIYSRPVETLRGTI